MLYEGQVSKAIKKYYSPEQKRSISMIIANRMYQLAICKWKMKQYGVHSQQVSWHEVDTDINEAILAFQHLCDSKGVPMCLDLIVKLILMRSICNG